MITGRKVYKEYMRYESDVYALGGGVKKVIYNVLTPPAFAFLKSLRRLEYHYNTPGIYHKLMLPYVYWRYLKFPKSWNIYLEEFLRQGAHIVSLWKYRDQCCSQNW